MRFNMPFHNENAVTKFRKLKDKSSGSCEIAFVYGEDLIVHLCALPWRKLIVTEKKLSNRGFYCPRRK